MTSRLIDSVSPHTHVQDQKHGPQKRSTPDKDILSIVQDITEAIRASNNRALHDIDLDVMNGGMPLEEKFAIRNLIAEVQPLMRKRCNN